MIILADAQVTDQGFGSAIKIGLKAMRPGAWSEMQAALPRLSLQQCMSALAPFIGVWYAPPTSISNFRSDVDGLP